MVEQTVGKLSDVKIKGFKEAGKFGDGEGLYLVVTPSTRRGAETDLRKTWVFRFQLNKRRREMGLGTYPKITLAKARELATAAGGLAQQGIDPVDARRGQIAELVSLPTFRELTADYLKNREGDWTNAKHEQQWTNTLTSYAFPVLGSMPFDQITPADLQRVLLPEWNSKRETLRRVRGRIFNVLNYGLAKYGLTDKANPAAPKSALDELLPKSKQVKQNFKAMDYTDVPAFSQKLAEQNGVGALALRFLIHTGLRTNEVMNMRWSWVDLEKSEVVIPAGEYKTRTEFRLLLTDTAKAILESLNPTEQEGNSYVFNSKGKQISNQTMSAVLKRMGVTDATVHGFRSSLRDYLAEETHTLNHVAEMCLGHAISSEVEKSYRRGDLIKHRREAMASWENYLNA